MIPTIEDNPQGLHARYQIHKLNGEPTDPDAIYFVLRLDSGGGDKHHIQACRAAARAYCQEVEDFEADHLEQVAVELSALVHELDRRDL